MTKSANSLKRNLKNSEEEGRAVEVVLPYRLKSLTYWHRGPFIPGARVWVTLKGKKKIGLLWGEAREAPPYLKETLGLLDQAPLLPKNLLSFLHWLADFYLAPAGEVVKYAVPASFFAQTRREKEAFKKETVAHKGPGFEAALFFGEDLKERASRLRARIERVLAKGGSCLFLFPDRELLFFYAERLKDLSPLVYTADLSPKRREKIWFECLTTPQRLILGTRIALFLPVTALALILLEEEEHHGYKQEEGFRANFRDLALMRAKLEEVPVVLASPSPSVKTYYLALKGIYHLEEGKRFPATVKLVALKEAKGLFSTKLLNALRRTLARKGQALLFMNRPGYAPGVVCENCGHLWLCPRCQKPLRYYREEALLRCPLCAYREKALPLCPQCGSEKVKPLGLGTERLKEIAKKFFPEARISLWEEKDLATADIVIATAKVSRFPPLERLTLVAALVADQLLGHPSYLAAERAYQLLKKLALIAHENEANFIIQTYHPEHHLYRGLLQGYEAFFREELRLRHEQGFPPFGRLAQLIIYPERAKVEEVVKVVENYLKEEAAVYFGPLLESVRGKKRLSFLLRAAESESLRSTLTGLKKKLDEIFKGRLRIIVDLSPE